MTMAMVFNLGWLLTLCFSVAYAFQHYVVNTSLPGHGSYIHIDTGGSSQYQSQSSVNQVQGQVVYNHLSGVNGHGSSSHISGTYNAYHVECTQYREYNDVLNLWNDSPCKDAIRAFQLLANIKKHHLNGGHTCLTTAIHKMAGLTSSQQHSSCGCHSNLYKHNYPYIPEYANSLNLCMGNESFKRLFNIFYQYEDINHHQYHTSCISHKDIWIDLNNMPHSNFDCQLAFVMHVDETYRHWRNFCGCTATSDPTTTKVATTPHPTATTSTSTQIPSTTPPTTSTATTTILRTTPEPTPSLSTTQAPKSATTTVLVPHSLHICPKLSTVLDIAQHNIASNVNASLCPSGTHQSPEAFVLNHCTVEHPATWIQGLKVMDNCNTIPLYTPVATFFSSGYVSNGGIAGVFLGCLPNGFKIGVQPCDQTPNIAHIELGGIFTKDPNSYFTIQ